MHRRHTFCLVYKTFGVSIKVQVIQACHFKEVNGRISKLIQRFFDRLCIRDAFREFGTSSFKRLPLSLLDHHIEYMFSHRVVVSSYSAFHNHITPICRFNALRRVSFCGLRHLHRRMIT